MIQRSLLLVLLVIEAAGALKRSWAELSLVSDDLLRSRLASPTTALTLLLQTLAITRVRPHPPTPNSILLEAIISLSIGGHFNQHRRWYSSAFPDVIRTQDVCATEKDRLKIGE